MLKKSFIIVCFVLLTIQSNAQFFRGVGIFVGVTMSSHRYFNPTPVDTVNFSHTQPAPSHRSAEYFSYSVGILGEFLKYDHIRWQTEIEYCNKGAIERPLLIPWPAERGGPTANTYTNIQWNNFAKIFLNEGYRGTPYLMLGGRIEYNMARAITAYPAVASLMPKITVTPDVGIGYEFSSYSKFKLFTELHYNPDLIKVHTGPLVFWNRTFELRVGVIYRPQKSLDDCNAPRYHGSDF